MIREDLIFVGTPDLAGRLRGKAFPAAERERRLQRGLGWTPTNVQITCFDLIAESPFGALGDLLLVPDPAAESRVDFDDGQPADHIMIGDLLELDGRPWDFCPRARLKSALARLERVTGLSLLVAFEHEFHLKGAQRPHGDAYSLAGFRAQAAFAEALMAALRQGGLQPDTVMKEYAPDQYEVTVAPAAGLRAADEASILREIVRSTALRLGDTASFTPLRKPGGVGNGVHIHMSFRDREGRPATYDPEGPDGMAPPTVGFVAGVLKYLDAIVALTAPAAISYSRLVPHRWSAAYNNLGLQDREASVRLCPISTANPASREAQFNFEYRAADAAASPHLALAAIVEAGVQGLEESLDAPEATAADLTTLSEAALADAGLTRLPQSLSEALDRFTGSETASGWFPPGFAALYRQHKEGELGFLEGLDDAEICAAYEASY
ncbi:MAG: glutamine synthetase family protein [Rhodospirillales bacterium]